MVLGRLLCYPRLVPHPIPDPVERTIEAIQRRGVTQTRLGSPYGNCVEAVIATVVGIPIEEVPDLRSALDLRGVNGSMVDRVMQYREGALRRWLAEHHGLWWVSGPAVHGGPLLPPAEWQSEPLVWIASGPSPRGLQHVVLFVDDRMAWDPHPDRSGLIRVESWGIFLPLGIPRSGPCSTG